MSDIIISIFSAICCFFVSIIILKIYSKEKEWNIFSIKSKKYGIFSLGFLFSLLSIVVCSVLIYDINWFLILKKLITISFLWILTYIDYKSHIIPNKILITMSAIWIVFIIADIVKNPNDIKKILINSLLACFIIIVLLCLMRLFSSGCIGYGDIKLFAILGLIFGIGNILTILFISFVASFITSIYLLASKKKKKTDKIAFAPFILVGTFGSIILFGV